MFFSLAAARRFSKYYNVSEVIAIRFVSNNVIIFKIFMSFNAIILAKTP